MDFIDNSGHIFSLPSYSEEPIGHEFEENDYIFWIDNEITSSLSVNNYYSRVINLVVPYNEYDDKSFDELVDITISLDSHKFWLLNSIDIQNLINENNTISNIVHNLNSKDNYKFNKLSNDDLCVLTMSNEDENSNKWPTSNVAVIPIYILGKSEDEGTWISNILIHVNNKSDVYDSVTEDWASISVGGIFKDENEILTINGQNLGITLPKEMFRAVYQQSFINDVFNEELYNLKIKEYLINFMNIKGERGNFRSANNSLKWFGYKDHLTLTKLIKTDNEIKDQYIHDWFNLKTDLIKSFKYFRNSTLLSIKLKQNQETGQRYSFDPNADFFGEGKPILEDLFKKEIPVKVGYDDDKWTYWKPYYDYTFYEMGLKLSCLKYYYETYFLPIHLKVHSATIAHKVYTNDIKFDNKVFNTVRTESIVNTEESFETDGNNISLKNNTVEFHTNNVRYFTHQIHFVDENFNEYKSYNNDKKDWYKIDDTCLSIPIKFHNDVINGVESPTYFDCVLLLEREGMDNERVNPYKLNILNYPLNVWYYNFEILDKTTKKPLNLNTYEMIFSEINQFNKSDIILGGIEGLKDYLKTYFSIPVTSKYYNIENGNYNLEFIYTNDEEYIKLNLSSLVNTIKERFNKYDDSVISNLINIINTLGYNDSKDGLNYLNIYQEPIEFIDKDWYIYIPPMTQFNFNPMNVNDIYGEICIIPKVNIQLKFDKTEIYDFILKPKVGNKISIKDKIRINYLPFSKVVYESHFNFVQNINNPDTIYNSFVLYPKFINNQNINYFVDKKFTLRLLVNGHWYKYDFETKMPDVNLKFGTLKYKYYTTSDNYYSRFSQLLDLTPDSVTFNSFMYHPEFVEVNHINFFRDLDNYIQLNALKYISNNGELLKLSNFNRYIDYEYYDEDLNVNKVKIYISRFITDKKIYIYFDTDLLLNGYSYFKLIPGNAGYILLGVNNDISEVLGDDGIYFDLNKMFFQGLYENATESKYVYFKILNNKCYSNKIIKKPENLVSKEGQETIGNEEDWMDIINDVKKYVPHLNNSVDYVNQIKEKIYLPVDFIQTNDHIEIQEIKYNIVPEVNNFYNNYTEKININNENYLNNILVFNIYTNNEINKNIFNNSIFGNVSLSANGITFSHNNFDEKIYFNGKTIWSENIDSKYLDLYGFYINQKQYKSPSTKSEEIPDSNILSNVEAVLSPGKFIYYVDENGELVDDDKKIEHKQTMIAQIILNNIEEFTHIEDKTRGDYVSLHNNIQNIKYENSGYGDSIIISYKTGEKEINKFLLNVKYIKIDKEGNITQLDKISNYDLYRINSKNNNGNLDIKLLCTVYKIELEYKEIAKEYEVKIIDDYNLNSYLNLYQDQIRNWDLVCYNLGKLGDDDTIYLICKKDNIYYAIEPEKLLSEEWEGKKITLISNVKYRDNRINTIINEEQPGLYVYNYESLGEISDGLKNLNTTLDIYLDGDHAQIESYNKDITIYKITSESGDQYLITYKSNINDVYAEMANHPNITPENTTILKNYFSDLRSELKKSNSNVKFFEHFDNKKSLMLNQIIYSKDNDKFNKIPFNVLEDKFNNCKDDDIVYVIYQYKNQNDLDPQIYKSYLANEILNGETSIKKEVEALNNEVGNKYIYKYTVTNKFNYAKNYLYTLDWDSADINNNKIDNISINLFILKDGSYEILNTKGAEFYVTEDVKSIQMSFLIDNTESKKGYSINGYIIPKIFSNKTSNNYSQLKYIPSTDENKSIEINIDGKKYIYDDNTDKDKVKLYNDFFEIDYLSTKKDEDGNLEENTGTVYEIEKLFNIEKNYLKWKTNHEFTYKNIDDYENLSTNSIWITDGNICWEYTLLDDEDILMYFDGLSEFNKYNLINLIKYDFSIKNYIDFYDCFVYKHTIKLLPATGFNNYTVQTNDEEIKIPDYFIEENYVKVIKQKINLKKFFDYDFYLMHDYDYWYAVFISKEVISKNININNTKISNDYKIIDSTMYQSNEYYDNNTPYILKLVGSSNEFLINRMVFEENEGINHFDNDKMIVVKLENNNKLPVDIFNSSKWEIVPKSIGMDKSLKSSSNQNMALISFPENNNTYPKGYYDVKVRYSLDKNIQHQLHKDGIIRIG